MKCKRCGKETHGGPCVFSPGKSAPEKIRDEMTSVKGRLTLVEKVRKS
jgi:hypothetical protein